MSHRLKDKTCHSLFVLKKISLELFYTLNDGVDTRSTKIPRTFITQTGKKKKASQRFLNLCRARGLQMLSQESSLDNGKSKRTLMGIRTY